MAVVRGLIVQGNDKLSAGIFHFDLPAPLSCPGRSSVCNSWCYAQSGRFLFPQVQERLAWNLKQSKRSDFVDRMVDELYRKGVMFFRWHVVGDVMSPAYARKMIDIMTRSPHCTFLVYTRVWRVAKLMPLLREMAKLDNLRLWLSADSETGLPPEVPPKARIAWMQVEENDQPDEGVDLLFRVKPLRKLSLPLAVTVCPTETETGKARGVSCSTCQVCLKRP